MSLRSVSRGRESQVVAIVFVTWGIVFLDRMAVLYLILIAPALRPSSAAVEDSVVVA